MVSALPFLAVGLFAGAAAIDLLSRRIPNILAAALALLGLVRIVGALGAGGGWAAPGLDLAVALGIFALGAVLFNLAVLGGGDVKLLAAGALWVGAPGVAAYLGATALAGGLLALAYLFGAFIARGAAGGRLRPGLPYGVAIAAGGILVTAGSL